MYYSEFVRIQKIEKLLERLAYFSVFLDFLVAVGTYFIIRGVQSYSVLLIISNYLLMIEVAFAAIIFVALIAVKHYRKLVDKIAIGSFRSRYVPITGVNGNPTLRKFFRVILAPFASKN